MGLLDRFRSKPAPVRKSGIEDYLEKNMMKDARTPVYSGVSTDLAYKEAIMPPVDQNYLEVLADRYSHLRTVVTRIASQAVAKEWEFLEVGTGNPEEKAAVKKILSNPTNGNADITGMEFFKAVIRQLEIFDDCWISVVYDRVLDNDGETTGKIVKELWVEDAKHMRFYVDGFGKFLDDKMFDPLTREFMSGTHNKDTGTKLVPMAYFYDVDGEHIPFARDEIIHFNKYSSTARLYGQSPIMGLSKKIETALAIEALQNKVYRLERPPKGFLDIPGHNEESLNRLGEYIAEETRRNPNFIPIISSQEGSNTAKFVSIMPNFDELMMLPYMDRINNDINASYGVMPLVVGDMSGVGGLNSEGEQITIFDRTIRETQRCVELGLIKPLLKLMGVSTWTIRFNDINERNETQYLNNMNLKAQIITQFQNSGIDVDLGEDGELVLPKSTEAVRQDFLRRSQESLEEGEPNKRLSTLTELYETSDRS
jgi:hypothetical protein|tara:strand:+ start:319 stop:1764 length:1446 start_codon:yes stop_codon:yes gene_type:complete